MRDSPFLNGITAGPVNDYDIYDWLVTIPGPEGSPFAGVQYKLSVKLPMTYPFEAPDVKFLTQINHPKITKEGRINLEILDEGNWNPNTSVETLLVSIVSLLTSPSAKGPAKLEKAKLL